MTIEGTSLESGKGGDYLTVAGVNGKHLASPVSIVITNLVPRDPAHEVSKETVCRFKGHAITYVIPDNWEGQLTAGRHYEFKVTEVLAPSGLAVE